MKSIAIVSDHLAGFIAAQILHTKGYNVTLIDTDHETRATDRFQGDRFCRLGLPFYRNTSQFRHGVRELADALQEVIDVSEVELPPQTIVDHEQRAFIGFGETKAEAVPALAHYNHASRLTLSKNENEIVKNLFTKIQFKWLPFAQVTAIRFDESAKDPAVEKITVNGQQNISADYFLFLTAQTPWLTLLPQDAPGARTRTRLMKSHVWSRIFIELSHAEAHTDENIFILSPTQADHNPCAGQFFNAADGTHKSAWETYILADHIEDAEFVASQIKHVRKMVKKAFAETSESITVPATEELSITPFAYADLHWAYQQKDLREVAKNLLIYPALGAGALGFAQSVECASWALDGLEARLEEAPRHNEAVDNTPSLL